MIGLSWLNQIAAHRLGFNSGHREEMEDEK
jgi:hypothetical protein